MFFLFFCITIWVLSVFLKAGKFHYNVLRHSLSTLVLYCLNIQFLIGKTKQMSLGKEKATICNDFLQERNDTFLPKQFASYRYNGMVPFVVSF